MPLKGCYQCWGWENEPFLRVIGVAKKIYCFDFDEKIAP